MPARTTEDEGFGSLLPTPTASSYGSSNNGCPHDGRDQYATKGKPSLAGMIPTPMGGSRAECGGTLMDASSWARERMASLIPTPTAARHLRDRPASSRKKI